MLSHGVPPPSTRSVYALEPPDFCDCCNDRSQAPDILHARELHAVEALELGNYRRKPLKTLSNRRVNINRLESAPGGSTETC